MQSATHRSFTIVTIMTLVFMSVFKGHHWVEVLTGVNVDTKVVQCQPQAPCPAHQLIVQKVVVPAK